MANDFYQPTPKVRWTAIDLDGTLAYSTWTPGQLRSVMGDPIAENIAKLRELVERGYEPFIHTGRPWNDYELVQAWVRYHGLPIERILCGKPLARRYVDDRGINARDEKWF